MLNSERSPTNPAAAAAVTSAVSPERKKSWIIGPACSRIPMPAVTSQKSTTHSSQNCGVRMALFADTFAVEIIGAAFAAAGSHPAGFQPGAGRRMRSTPTIMITR